MTRLNFSPKEIIDPWAGSYAMESLTTALEEKAKEIIDEVEALGGMAKAVTQGMPKRRIEESAAQRQAKIDSGEEGKGEFAQKKKK